MTTSKFYRPKMATLTRKEKAFLDASGEAGLLYFIPDEPIMTRNVAAQGVMKSSTRVGAYNVGNFQITYSFSSAIRKNRFPLRGARKSILGKKGTYGASGLSFRLLYDFLCREFNNGEYFIDVYFEKIFSTRSVYKKFARLNKTIAAAIEAEKQALLEKVPLKMDGTPNMWYKVSKHFMNFKAWKDPIVKSGCAEIAAEIRSDIIRCLSTSKIPLRRQAVSEATVEKRRKLTGLDAHQFFYASGQLIEHLSIYVELEV